MSGTPSTPSTVSTDNRQRWAELDKQYERMVDATHPLLAELRRDYPAVSGLVQPTVSPVAGV
jgi:hypothetical protein